MPTPQIVSQLHVLPMLQRFDQLLPVLQMKFGAEHLMLESDAKAWAERQLNSAGVFE